VSAEVEQIARVCHEANRAWCEANGDTSQPAWDDAPEWQRSSALAGVEGALGGNTPEQSHESWSALKMSEGWVYGDTKDPEAKTHPCLVSYADLPPEQRVKDHLFIAVVAALSEA
jgi:hypothetical protein